MQATRTLTALERSNRLLVPTHQHIWRSGARFAAFVLSSHASGDPPPRYPRRVEATLRVVRSADLTRTEWMTLTALCIAAFDEPWDDYWDSIGPGVHVLAENPERGIVAHAAIVDRPLYPGELTLRSGYVEAVAVWPDLQRGGLGTLVMERIDQMLDQAYELGALGTGSHEFYRRLGWVAWEGPTWIRERDGSLQRSPDEDGDVMVRLTPMTPRDLDLSLPIAVDWRPGEVW